MSSKAQDAVFGATSGSTTESSDSSSDTDPSKPHVDMEFRDGREEDAVRQHEYRAQSNKHASSKKGGHGADPFKRMLHDHVEKAFNQLRSQTYENRKKRRREAPFRVVLRSQEGEKVRMYYWHGVDILKLIGDCAVPVAKGILDVRVQKRVSNKQEWHSGRNQPHLNTIVDLDEPLLGLEKMVQTYNWDVWKTRLPEIAQAKAMA